jgi:hypothetical protein
MASKKSKGKKLAHSKSLKSVKPLTTNTYVTINGTPGDSTPIIAPGASNLPSKPVIS